MKNARLFFASLVIALGAFLSLNSFSAANAIDNGNEDAQLIGRARGAVGSCIGQSNNSYSEIDAQVETIGICFVSGELKRVSFYRISRCNEAQNDPCPRPLVQLVATVDFDCEGNVVGSQCLN